jgi:hypothetical protein
MIFQSAANQKFNVKILMVQRDRVTLGETDVFAGEWGVGLLTAF